MSKQITFRLRMDDATKDRLDALAAHYAVSASSFVRMLLKEKFDAVQPASSPCAPSAALRCKRAR